MNIESSHAAYIADPSDANRDRLVVVHYGMCRRAARKFRRPGTDLADLEQVAVIGLLKAIRYFQADFKTPFEGYAWILIVGELMHYVRDFERSIRLPRRIRARERSLRDASERLTMSLGRFPSASELATHLGLALDEIDEIRRLDGGTVSIDGVTVSASIPDIEDELCLRLAIEDLPDRERRIVRGTFEEGLTQTELASSLGITQSHISKLLARALTKLHRAVA
jgi:RNA polymerase sigma-B factor